MTNAIIGFGAIGQALARAFSRSGLEVAVASTHPPDTFAAAARAIGPGVVPRTLADALAADVLFLAVPFAAHRAVAASLPDWRGKTLIDATNAFGVPLSDLDDLPSSAVVAKAFTGAGLARAFNHLPATTLAENPAKGDMRRVVFVSSDDDATADAAATIVGKLGFAPVKLGTLAEGGRLVQARNRSWAPLIFQDLFKPVG